MTGPIGPGIPPPPPPGRRLRPSEIKTAIYGTSGRQARRGGLRFDRVLYAGWSFSPAPGIVAKDINKLGLRLDSFREPLIKAIRLVMMPSIRKNFEEGGRPDRWEPLAPYTVEVRGNSGPILVRSGALKRVASSFSIWSIGDTSAAIKALPSNVWYGNLHQSGYGSIMDVARKELGGRASAEEIKARAVELFMGARPARQQTKIVIPQREFALFQPEDIEAIQDIFIEWMENEADKVGRGWYGK